jgi:hypothetical protein
MTPSSLVILNPLMPVATPSQKGSPPPPQVPWTYIW